MLEQNKLKTTAVVGLMFALAWTSAKGKPAASDNAAQEVGFTPAKEEAIKEESDEDNPASKIMTEIPPESEPNTPTQTAELGDEVAKGLAYLVNQQQDSGGWNQGGGWRTSNGGGRVEGTNVLDPTDPGNTSIAALALIRAGNQPAKGRYADNVHKAVMAVIREIEAADKESLYITDVRSTQLQVKIGTYVDTFLSVQLLSEVKGHMKTKDDESRLKNALAKAIAKMERHQTEQGTWGGQGWANVISQGIAVKGLNLAKQRGMKVSEDALKRSETLAREGFNAKSGSFAASPAATDAGVQLYSAGSGFGSLKDSVLTGRAERRQLETTLADAKAPPAAKADARARLDELKKSEEAFSEQSRALVGKLKDQSFVAGFGSNGGEEYWSLMNISESLALKGGKEWTDWHQQMKASIGRAQNGDGSWTGHHCITGKTFTTATALLTLMADRAPRPKTVASAGVTH